MKLTPLEKELQRCPGACRKKWCNTNNSNQQHNYCPGSKTVTQTKSLNQIHTWRIFMELPPKTLLNTGHRFCGIKLDHIQHILRVSHKSSFYCYINSCTPSGHCSSYTSLLPHVTKNWKFLFISYVKQISETTQIICVHSVQVYSVCNNALQVVSFLHC